MQASICSPSAAIRSMVLREAGFLYINEKVKIHPLILGGGQQKGMRSGTDNVPGIAGLGAAAADCYKDFEEKQKKLRALRNYFIEEVEKLPDIQVNGPKEEEKAAPQIVSVSFRGVRSEVSSARTGGTGHLCLFRLCLLFQQETAGASGSIERNPSGIRIFWIPHFVSASAMRRQRKNWITVWRI